ncbi:MAG: presqualene diphosphate synthase HpnD [Rhodocyclaceae bacterium]|nr:presqualene diphosphate synthase HpnD [Rhodocyclaceae bacterium]MBK9311804.1 presqualene diphosphate synthase HpnD [Rhodocyclaceae bacterium]MBK9956841.1 presqualene diphosphate synthase HpnD [Rhodocyclaceae bacterium]
MSPDEYCRRKAAASGSSFYYGFRFLDAPRRRAIMALYAFCREVDDAVDECSDAGVAAMKLAWWRSEVAAMYDGRPTHPVTQALTAVLPEVNLPAEQLQEIIDGMAMDLRLTRYPDFRTLNLYCYRVASVVGLLAAEIFGYTDRRTQKYAHDLGLAFQLTNIIRDVGEDARRGRIYLPQDELARFGVREADILASRPTPEFTALMAFQVRRALDAYDRALGELPAVDRKTQRPGLMMAAIYRALLDEIVEDGCRVLTHRISLPPARKLWLAAKAWLHG